MIRINGIHFNKLEDCEHMLETAKSVVVYDDSAITKLPDMLETSYVQLSSLPNLAEIPESPNAQVLVYWDLPLVLDIPNAPLAWSVSMINLPLIENIGEFSSGCKIESIRVKGH